jgi:hypothetical protein
MTCIINIKCIVSVLLIFIKLFVIIELVQMGVYSVAMENKFCRLITSLNLKYVS